MSQLQLIYETLIGRGYAPQLFAELGEGRQSGQFDRSTTCPFCGKKKKFTYSLIKPLWNCWSCEERGSWVDYLIKHRHLDFREALKLLADDAGITLADYDPKVEAQRQRNSSVLEDAHGLYRAALMKRETTASREVWAYLLARGYTEDEVQSMELGCALPERALRRPLEALGYSYTEMRDAGLLTQGFGETHTLSLLWGNAAGRAVGLVCRSLMTDKELKERDLQKYKYSRGMRKNAGLLGLPKARGHNEVLLVEGVLDALYLTHHGIPTVASGGTSLAVEQSAALSRARIRDLLVCYDSDQAGQQATLKLLRELYSANDPKGGSLRPYVVTLPAGSKDPDELVRADGAEAMKRVMKGAVTGGEWLGHWLAQAHEWDTPRGKDQGWTR